MNAQKRIEAKQNELNFIIKGDDEWVIKEVE